MNRRTFIRGAVVAASTPATIGLVAYDPLMSAITEYRAGLIAFGRLTDEEYGTVETYEPWQAILDNWNEPARTRESALEALRFALGDEDGVYGCEAADRMVRAVIGYLENAA
ncbi:hypothetical protein ACIQUG_08190 [Ensifer sp. NPDC090286]|uniref:hypothetical protein n=1 Tax=Ensifer sp. NPDC090286 TaxID=3363991 RepID=UPI00383BAF39